MDTHDVSFLGKGWGFPPRFEKNSRTVRMSTAEEDIEESLLILLSTAPGERFMQPRYGCGLHKMVFAQVDDTAKTVIKNLVSDAVLFFEPRIKLESVHVSDGELDKGVLHITLDYVIRATNSRSNMVYPFYLREGTNL